MAKKHLVTQSNLPTEIKSMLLIGCIAQEMKADMEQRLVPVGLTAAQIAILHALDYGPEDGMTVNQLKAVMIEDNPNVSRTLNRLVETGHVTKLRSTEDQRVVHVAITDKGRKAHHEGDAQMEDLGLGLNEEDLETLYAILKKI